MSLTLLVSVIALIISITAQQDYCCCCDRSGFWDINRIWTESENCISPKHCCNIPSKYECELALNPTYDTACGHVNEGKVQSENGGPDPVKIPRDGFENPDYEMEGWFIFRIHDNLHNEVQLWCIDNDENYSFYLFRFVECSGAYPNWFGRCAFPAAQNTLRYDACADDVDDFTTTLPTCFGGVEHTNIGLGKDYGLDIDHRYDVDSEHLAIWCTRFDHPENPGDDALYNGDAFGKDDGIVPLYLEDCRERAESMPSALVFARPDESILNITHEMTFLFQVEVNLDPLPLPVNEFMFVVSGSDMAPMYEARISNGDYWSIGLDEKVMNAEAPHNWKVSVKEVDNAGSFVTWIYEGRNTVALRSGIEVHGFKIDVAMKEPTCEEVGWIAKSGQVGGRFDGFGTIEMC